MLVEVRDWEGEALFGAPYSGSVFIRVFDNDVLPVFVVCVMPMESLMVGYVGASRRRSRELPMHQARTRSRSWSH
jgi:hypothetical protein